MFSTASVGFNKPVAKNTIIAILVGGFSMSVYFYSIKKMKEVMGILFCEHLDLDIHITLIFNRTNSKKLFNKKRLTLLKEPLM